MTGQIFGRYEVLERIGAGGMGEVYRAHDMRLERDVALKVLPSGILADEASRRRFRREALALSKLNHPNIATIFDFDSQRGVDFLAMELVRGTVLSERVKAGPLREREVLRIGVQLADGLAAAHAEGVIHRDLKPGNLMIAADGRLKILDFGLAMLVRPNDDADVTRSGTNWGSVGGTLPYMPPEQLRGLPGDARSDVYAAGAVLYELATARRPFPQTQSGELIGAILHESPLPPGAHNRLLSAGLERVVLKSLQRDPSHRYQSARELLVALEELGLGGTAARRPRGAIAAVGAALVAVALVAISIAANVAGMRDRVRSQSIVDTGSGGISNAGVRVRRAVAVLGLKSLSGRPDEAWLSTALSEMLTTELAAGEQLRTSPGESVAQMKTDLSLVDAESYGRDTLARIRSNLGTDDVVFGSYLVLAGGQVRLDLRLQNAVSGETLAATAERGSMEQLDELVNRAGAVLRGKLGAGPVSQADALAVKRRLPMSPDAVRLYAEGLAAFRAFDSLSARDLLEKAVAADSDNALAHSALASVWSSLGYDEKAKAEATRAYELSRTLSREDQLAVEGQYHETTAEHEKAIAVYRTLSEFFPDSLEYSLRLAAAQTAAGRPVDALMTIETLRRLAPPSSEDPRIDLAEADAAAMLSDFKRQQVAAERAVARGSVLGARLLVARAQMSAGLAHRQMGSLEQANSAYENARTTFAAAAERAGVARALSAIGSIADERGDFSTAKDRYEQALAIQREVGDNRSAASTLYALGGNRYRRDDLPAAKRFFEEALRIHREINATSGVATDLNGLGVVLMDQGDYAGSLKMYEESLAIARRIGQKSRVATALNNTAMVLLEQSDFAAARRRAEEALAIRREIGDKSGVASTLRNLGAVFQRQDNVRAARRSLEEALAIQKEIGQGNQAAYTLYYLASVLIDEGEAARAEMLAREAVEEHRSAKAFVEEARALQVLAESQLAQGKLEEAQRAIDAGAKPSTEISNRAWHLSILVTGARVRAAAGGSAQATRSLLAIVAEATQARLVGVELEARLALGEIEVKSGKTAAGRARLAALQRDANAKGFPRIARKASATADYP